MRKLRHLWRNLFGTDPQREIDKLIRVDRSRETKREVLERIVKHEVPDSN